MRQLHKNNHYVPQLYLRGWASENRIPTYSLLVEDPRVPLWTLRSLKSVAYRPNLYTRSVDGVQDDALERWLDREFEAPAVAAFKRAIADQRLAPDDWRKLVRFAFAQDVRTPARLRQFHKRQAASMPALLETSLSSALAKLSAGTLPPLARHREPGRGLPLRLTVDAAEDDASNVGVEALVGRSMWQWTIDHLLTKTIEKISMKGWTILKPASGFLWPTSDNPVVRLNYFGDYRYDFDGGWEVQNGDVIFPLSPDHLMFRCLGSRPRSRGSRVDVETTRKIQRIIIENADRFVFSKSPFRCEDIRQRVVNGAAFRDEKAFWERWDAEQIDAERGYSS
ncbi:DUF4238 domain-containing protein [Stenotrophomonas sp. ZAC14A_NAIMI4_1]|uniref:DUF4238 domain-containing protein n=1 Tax=Stenotrophomonas sp. ZAC14A_NAIMI4_1 TaxID=2072412 RepID=UPI000D54153F|nr:DUF4238 domain-containing protein [Stenotrophomonas sp. ZAC14A_NAIMI4_1]AWH45784.1 hypothetical protein C1926_12440 [Stenotrophomonas sp. ZAC14A_NAIMI4_1]